MSAGRCYLYSEDGDGDEDEATALPRNEYGDTKFDLLGPAPPAPSRSAYLPNTPSY